MLVYMYKQSSMQIMQTISYQLSVYSSQFPCYTVSLISTLFLQCATANYKSSPNGTFDLGQA